MTVAMLDRQQKSLSSRYSRTELARLSVPPRRAELFLERLANLDKRNYRRTKVFIDTFSDLLPTQGPPMGIEAPIKTFKRVLFGADSGGIKDFLWFKAQPLIQEVWRDSAAQIKEWGFMRLAAIYMTECANRIEPVGPDGFLMVLLHALKHVHLLRYCANPECKEPYFVARRGSQIYCSSPCAEPAQREAKSKWWREHGDARRKKSNKKRGRNAKAKKA